MGITGQGGSVNIDRNGYDEPEQGSSEGENHSNSDYQQAVKPVQNRYSTFRDRRASK